MAESLADGSEIDPSFEQMDGGRVAQRMGVNSLSGQGRSYVCANGDIFLQEVSNAKSSHLISMTIMEDILVGQVVTIGLLLVPKQHSSGGNTLLQGIRLWSLTSLNLI